MTKTKFDEIIYLKSAWKSNFSLKIPSRKKKKKKKKKVLESFLREFWIILWAKSEKIEISNI